MGILEKYSPAFEGTFLRVVQRRDLEGRHMWGRPPSVFHRAGPQVDPVPIWLCLRCNSNTLNHWLSMLTVD